MEGSKQSSLHKSQISNGVVTVRSFFILLLRFTRYNEMLMDEIMRWNNVLVALVRVTKRRDTRVKG